MESEIYMPDNIATKIERSENKLTKVLTECDVTPAGQAWIDNSFDPFKDSQGRPPCMGRPGAGQRNIVVSKFVTSQTISRPASVPAGSNWDCHILNTQLNNVVPMSVYTMLGNNVAQAQGNAPTNLGGIVVMTGAAGATLDYATNTATCLGLPTTYFAGANSARVIAKAHEVRNTTAALTVQGQQVYYERTMPDPLETIVGITFCDGAASNRFGSLNVIEDLLGPRSPAELLQLPKSRQMHAKEGIYQVCTECSVTNSPGTDRAVNISWIDNTGRRYFVDPVWPSMAPAVVNAPSMPTANIPFVSPFNVNGTYFQGLSSDSTLVVTGIWIVETTPSTADSRLMSLAHPSPPYDYCAEKIYAKMAHDLQAGTAVINNGVGDWIANIADLAAASGLPGAGLIGTGAKLINKIQDFYNTDYGRSLTTGNNVSGRKKRPPQSATKPRVIRVKGPVKRINTNSDAKPVKFVIANSKNQQKKKVAKKIRKRT